ncbi:hypothetical protein B0H19DRAFT_1197674, partial [Mycena capillaripes]
MSSTEFAQRARVGHLRPRAPTRPLNGTAVKKNGRFCRRDGSTRPSEVRWRASRRAGPTRPVR